MDYTDYRGNTFIYDDTYIDEFKKYLEFNTVEHEMDRSWWIRSECEPSENTASNAYNPTLTGTSCSGIWVDDPIGRAVDSIRIREYKEKENFEAYKELFE